MEPKNIGSVNAAEEKAAEDRVLREAIERYGEDLQLTVLLEEMSELAKEICKRKRGRDNEREIAEEAADVRIMLRQLEMILHDKGKMRMFERTKIKRLSERLAREVKGKMDKEDNTEGAAP